MGIPTINKIKQSITKDTKGGFYWMWSYRSNNRWSKQIKI